MKINCNVISDLIPLVVEDLASNETIELVKNHIEECESCKKEYEDLKKEKLDFKDIEGKEYKNELEAAPLNEVKRKLKNKNIYTGIISALLISLFLLVTFDKLTKPIPIIYEDAIESTKVENERLFINFSSELSNYSIVKYNYNGNIEYEIMGWKNILNSIQKEEEKKNVVVKLNEKENVSVRYISQGNSMDKYIYRKTLNGPNSGSYTLPRLAMNFYLFVFIGIFVVSFLLRLIFKKKVKLRKIFREINFLSLSYILGHILILGFSGSTHHIIRDLVFVLGSSLLIFSVFTLYKYKDWFIRNIR